jgi:tRNA pseudouridine32 synthase/23S rRNA pseudouridine746 synthase
MADPKDTTSFFRKVVKFVANPATEWNELGQPAPGSIESELAKSELKAMIERKRRNDFVRKREFDMLRKVRRDGLTPEQLAALGGSSAMGGDSVPRLRDSEARSGPGMKAKIDAIEQQMVGNSQVGALRRPPEFYAAPTQAAPLGDSAHAQVQRTDATDSTPPYVAGLSFSNEAGGSSFDKSFAAVDANNELAHDPELDEAVIAFNKPAGLSSQGGRIQSHTLDDLLWAFARSNGKRPDLVHRLDRDTSGCLLLSRNPKAHARLQQAFEAGTVRKRYVAILDGVPQGAEGEIDLPLVKISSAERGWRMTGDPAGKAARTRWRLLGEKDGKALVELHPATGRTHQIRVHALEGLGVPVLGDPVYGTAHPAGMMLHAAELVVPRPGKPDAAAQAPWPARAQAYQPPRLLQPSLPARSPT